MAKKKSSKKAVATKDASKDTRIVTKSDSSKTIVKVISVLGYIGAGFGILCGLILLFGGSFILGILQMLDMPAVIGALAGAAIIVISVIMIIFSIFWIFVSKALWNHKEWGRVVYIVFSAIGFVGAIISLPSSIVSLIVHGFVIYFLAFNKDVKALFA